MIFAGGPGLYAGAISSSQLCFLLHSLRAGDFLVPECYIGGYFSGSALQGQKIRCQIRVVCMDHTGPEVVPTGKAFLWAFSKEMDWPSLHVCRTICLHITQGLLEYHIFSGGPLTNPEVSAQEQWCFWIPSFIPRFM